MYRFNIAKTPTTNFTHQCDESQVFPALESNMALLSVEPQAIVVT